MGGTEGAAAHEPSAVARRVRLASIVNRYPSPSETFIERKARALTEAGFDVTIAAHQVGPAPGGADDPVASLQLPIVRRPSTWWGTARLLAGDAPARRRVRAVGAELRHDHGLVPIVAGAFDIVHFEFSGIAASMVDSLEHLRPARLSVSCRGTAERITPHRDPERADRLARVFDTVDLVHCVSLEMAEVVAAYGAPEEKVLVNRPAVDTGRWAGVGRVDDGERGTADRPLRVLSVARLHWTKGFDDAVRAVAAARRAGFHIRYRIAGDGPERDKLLYLRHSLGLEAEIELLGWQDQADVEAHLGWADAFVLSSLSEGISNSALEAMAAGVPVVSTRCGGMAEVLSAPDAGLLVDVGDVGQLAEALHSLGDPARRSALAAGATAVARADFDLARQAQVFATAYRELLATEGPS
ncbi:MAG: glycosyltransferase family 4 protein [Acidimicrobiales bacterium]|nr:glycosyltransferase family 4 protein [Acidimicrobiales bacterium]HRW36482.1 glycosyltransferase family 4 protein [Aquihabitans sp.]